MIGESKVPTPYATICRDCGPVFMTEKSYEVQMSLPDSTWRCARCHCEADWDDENYEKHLCEKEDEIETWLQEAHDYADCQLNLGVQQCNQMDDTAAEVRAWETGKSPMEWVDEWSRNRHPEDR